MTDNNTESDKKKNPNIEEESELSFLEWAINKIVSNDYPFTPEERIRAYTVVYNMCLPADGAEEVYEIYKQTFKDFVSSEVLPQLRGKNGRILLKELGNQWVKYKNLQQRLFRLFDYLERYFIQSRHLPSLLETSHLIVYSLVWPEMEDPVTLALESEIYRELNGEELDEAILEKVKEIYDEITRVIHERC